MLSRRYITTFLCRILMISVLFRRVTILSKESASTHLVLFLRTQIQLRNKGKYTCMKAIEVIGKFLNYCHTNGLERHIAAITAIVYRKLTDNFISKIPQLKQSVSILWIPLLIPSSTFKDLITKYSMLDMLEEKLHRKN